MYCIVFLLPFIEKRLPEKIEVPGDLKSGCLCFPASSGLAFIHIPTNKMLSFLPTGTNLRMKSPEGPVLDGITVERRTTYEGIRFSVAAAEGRPERKDITGPHLLGYYNKYVEAWHGSPGFWDSLHNLLVVKDGPYAGLTLKEVEIAGPERDQSKPFPLDGWIPQGASFHVKYPGDAPESEPCSFFATGEDGAGFMPAGDPTLWSAEKLVATYCERFGLPIRDPYSVIIWRAGDYKGLSLRASKARLDAKQRKPEDNEEEELAHWRDAVRERRDRDTAYNAAWARAQATVELERKALAEASTATAEEAVEAVETMEAMETITAPPPPSVAEALALIQAKEAALLQQVEELEDLKAARERVTALELRIAELKSELNIE